MKAEKIEQIKVDDLIPYVRNARTHSTEQIAQIAGSIKEFGFNNPILIDKDNGVIAGHGRLAAARKLKLESVPCVRLEHLTDAQRKAYILADNRIALNSDWETDLLATELEELKDLGVDLECLGFNSDEIDALLNKIEGTEGLTDEDDAPEVQEQAITKPGDIWVMGKHRLMCGDSTSIDAVDKLMDGNIVDMVFTDPPYNVAFNGRSGKHDVIVNDNLADDEFDKFIGEVLQIIKAVNAPSYYIWCNWKFYGTLQRELEYKSCIVWAKNVFGMGTNYRHQHEFCLFNGSIDPEIKNESDLWQVKKDINYIHPTQKPVELSQRAFGNHKKAKNILDLFGGSGSTLIGCEKMTRRAFLMEIDPKYCDVIVKRWEEFSGKKAVLESTGQTYDELTSKSEIQNG